ncbi:hypothetical protein HK413_08650 [Mucilaginibacter sp. S1162]|uniref:Uncharacterized protein n=1 Tax=Mucilaginibacter humi TaxID=2732510 RepID=A0ABX1W1T8_9SPHI|nr:hypothetical protein [Mucilaginibacter humi]NNU34196.1 hypothetical protein [Mucilaginibacter humi]
MEIAMKNEGLKLNRIWGTNMGHGYTKAAAKTVDSLLAIARAKEKTRHLQKFILQPIR